MIRGKILTHEQAIKLICHKSMNGPFIQNCCGNECMAWHVVHKAESREDHSDAFNVLTSLGCGRRVLRKGPPGSSGILYLEEVGCCGAINNRGGDESK